MLVLRRLLLHKLLVPLGDQALAPRHVVLAQDHIPLSPKQQAAVAARQHVQGTGKAGTEKTVG